MTEIFKLLFLYGALTACSFGAQNGEKTKSTAALLKEGFGIEGIEGTVTVRAEGKSCIFTPAEEIGDDRGTIPAGAELDMLPCTTLEKIVTFAGDKKTAEVKLWGMVTEYGKKNYLYGHYFLPMGQATEQMPEPVNAQKVVGTEPNDTSIIPPDILKMLKPGKTVKLAEIKDYQTTGTDYVLTDRAGFFIIETDGGKIKFSIDGLGQKIDGISFELLPCAAFEQTEKDLAKTGLRKRYRIAGTVTSYMGRRYLLLHRAVRTYNYGNFGG